MKAYELFCQDMKENELIRSTGDRRTYYRQLRQLLRDEVAGGAECELLTHYAKRLDSGKLTNMYLLDAAALWECYEAVIDGLRFPRDMAQGVPVPLESGRRLSWNEVQRLSDAGTLPVAVVDEELGARLQGLAAYAKSQAADLPLVNHRARIRTAEAAEAAQDAVNPAPRGLAALFAPLASSAKKEDGTSRLKGQLAQQEAQIKRLQAEKESLSAEVAQLRAQPASAGSDELMELILRGKLSEAAAEAARLNSRLEEQLQQLQRAQSTVSQLEEQVESTRSLLQAATAQATALRAQQAEAVQAETALRSECAQMQAETAARQKERLAAEGQLSEARAELSRQNTALRTLQRQLAETNDAARLTRRQAERLS